MKILFLDIDGVCNSANYARERAKPGMLDIDPDTVPIIRRIIEETGCSVVLSSSWRLDKHLRDDVREHIVKFIDVTPDNRGLTDRGCEVIAWRKQHPEVTTHAILDDSTDFHKDQPFFKTDWQTGITEQVADKVIAHLNGGSHATK